MKKLTDILNESFILSESSKGDFSDFDKDIINVLKKYEDSNKNIKLSDLNSAFNLYKQGDFYTLEWGEIEIDGRYFGNMDDAMEYFEEEYPEEYEGIRISTDIKITNILTDKSIVVNVYYDDRNGGDGGKLKLIKGEKMDKFPSKLCNRIYYFWGDNIMFYLNDTLSKKNILKVCCK